MTNVYSKAIATVATDRSVSATNVKRMSALSLAATRKEVAALLKAANVDSARFDKRAMYATEKVVRFTAAIAQDTVAASDFNDNAFAAMKTVVLAAAAKQNVTFEMLQAALSKDVKITDKDTNAIVYRRNAILSPATLNAQSQQVRDMLLTMNVVSAKSKNVFEVNTKNAIFKAAQSKIAELTL